MKPAISVFAIGCLAIVLVSGCSRGTPQPGPSPASGPESPLPKVSKSGDASGVKAGFSTDPDIEKLIDQLADISEPGFGYSMTFSGSEFLPYEETGQMTTLVLGATHAARSDALREIVRRGVSAVPSLLKHIGDGRPTKMTPVSGMMWMDFSDEYDFNKRTRKNAPERVNRDKFGSNLPQPSEHTVTMGDLCFVGLGQIVNRHFAATRYQPSGGLIVSSPTHSEALRKVILEDWSALSPDSHKQLLIDDFEQPDYEERRTGAYLRLALYYPEAVEALVVNELSKQTFDVFVIDAFCRNTLYKIDNAAARRAAYEDFLRQHGEVFAVGVQEQLFNDLNWEDMYGLRPRQLLTQLFGHSASVKSDDRPGLEQVSQTERARFIGTLTHDDSQKVGDLVKALFLENSNDDYFAGSCLRCLASRGYADFLIEQLEKIDPKVAQGNKLFTCYIEAMNISREPTVRAKLFEILKHSADENYFMAALPAVDRSQHEDISDAARKLLARLPDDSKEGEQLLRLIGERLGGEAKGIYQAFLSTGSASRADTMCRVLWYGHPLSKEILAPLLDDKRELPGFSARTRVCDRAAQAISHASKDIRFDSDWSLEMKDEQIEKLKRFCKDDIQ